MAGTIKGITIEIEGSTVGLQKSLSDVNKKSRDLQSELKQVDKALKFNPDNVELLAQKQQLLTEEIGNTNEKLNRLKQAQEQVEQKFQNGEIGADQYRAFQREIIQTESKLNGLQKTLSEIDDGSAIDNTREDLKKLSKDADNAQGSVQQLGGELAGLAAGALAGVGIGGIIEKSLDTSNLNTKIDITFDVPESSKAAVKDAVKGIEAYGVDAESALEGVRRQWALNKTVGDDVNAAIVKGAAVITSSYAGLDFTEVVQEIHEIGSEFGISSDGAMGLVNSLLRIGFPPDQLDVITEYGGQLVRAGYKAQEVQAIMAAGVETGTWNIDNLLDGLKEGRIKMAEFGQEVPKSTAELLKGTDISAKQLQAWGKAVAAGGQGGSQAMQAVATALQGVDDETKRNAIGVAVFGTMYEDQGQNITNTLLNAKNMTVDWKTNQDQLNTSVAQLDSSPQVQLNQALTDMNTALTPLLTSVAEMITKIAQWIQENPTLAATIAAVATVLGIIIGLGIALTPVFLALTGASTALNISMLPITATVLAVVAVIVALIAIGVLLYKNWDTIKEKASEFVSAVGQKFGEFKASLSEKMSAAKDKVVEVWENMKSNVTNKAQEIWSAVTSKFNDIKESIMSPIRQAVSAVSEQVEKIKGFFSGLSLKLPSIKTPHFNLKNWSINPIDWISARPYIDVEWYKNGGLFPANSPRMIGIGDASVPEAALPLSDKVLGTIASMISQHMNGGGGHTYNFYPQKAVIEQNDIIRELQRMEVLYGR